MAFSNDLSSLVTSQISRFVTLQHHQLAGHVANLEFWLGQVRNALEVIDGYNKRFKKLREVETKYTLHRMPDNELSDSRKSLCEATYRFLVRCFKEGLIQESQLRQSCHNLNIGVEASDLKSLVELYSVWRVDDTGNSFLVREHLSQQEADQVVSEFTARGHKQMYWSERENLP